MLYLNNIFHDKYIIPPLVIGLTEASVGHHFILKSINSLIITPF
jgi:hypothetical protein